LFQFQKHLANIDTEKNNPVPCSGEVMHRNFYGVSSLLVHAWDGMYCVCSCMGWYVLCLFMHGMVCNAIWRFNVFNYVLYTFQYVHLYKTSLKMKSFSTGVTMESIFLIKAST